MHAHPRRVLHTLLRRYGPGLVADPQRTEALLWDLCGEHETEIFVLIHAQRSGILADLNRAAGQRAEAVLRRRLARRLQERYAFSAEAAAWAVDAWADALNIRAVPIYQGWLLALGHLLSRWVGGLWQSAKSAVGLRSTPSRQPARDKRSIFFPLGVQWKQLSRAATLILVAATVTVLGVGALWQIDWTDAMGALAFAPSRGESEAEWQPPSPASAATALASRYPPPQEARIEADLLNVRASPTLDAEIVGKIGPRGVTVTVDAFNEAGDWSHIAAPVAGWISNEFVTFAGLYVRPGLAQVRRAGTPIRGDANPAAPAIQTLVAGQVLVLVALSPDRVWWQIAEPAAGWVESQDLEVLERE